ncbi:mechanosensitive ion channel domain-containing protein [Gluconacetobacter tumulisoli]|uniref:Mechanosensitive ion channel n=1 Tax=Gluconacetobacter tumulisoli TaxID=1286189 RepID=A0A7W4K8G6_9PROT|nr:mechanosensitive ion channel domain-containing protein [Gluconacetobacter tumulisoli]MBB2202319.1 mechanosensitive ion channel [Gluconacetobacter tumulisoli]
MDRAQMDQARIRHLVGTLSDPDRRAAFLQDLRTLGDLPDPALLHDAPVVAAAPTRGSATSAPAASASAAPAVPPSAAPVRATPTPTAAPTAPPAGATTATPPATDRIALAPGSLGAEMLTGLTGVALTVGQRVRTFGALFVDLRDVGTWFGHMVRHPGSRAFLTGLSWRLALVMLAGIVVERVLSIPLARRVRRLDARLATRLPAPPPASPPPPAPLPAPAAPRQPGETGALANAGPDARPDPDGNADRAAAAQRERDARLRRRTARALRLTPWVALRLVLDLLPPAAFFGIANLAAPALVDQPRVLAVILIVADAYVIARLVTVVLDALLSPRLPHLRPLPLRDETAGILAWWMTALALVPIIALCVADAGQVLDLPDRGQDAIGRLIVLVEHVLFAILIVRVRRPVANVLRPLRQIHPRLANSVFDGLADRWWIVALVLDFALWLVWAAQIPDGYLRVWRLSLTAAAILVAFRVLAILLFGLLDRTFRPRPDTDGHLSDLSRRGARYYPFARRGLAWALAAAGLVALLQAWGMPAFQWFGDGRIGRRLVSAASTILVALAVGVAVWEYVNAVLDRQITRYTTSDQGLRAMRLRTLSPILRTVLLVCLIIVVAMTMLSQIGLNIAPLLAGAGIIGVAVGFGSQKLVQDFITGIFLLLENAMEVGDWVTAGGLSGSVETLSIRTLRLRAADGSVHIIPFSAVSTVTNTNRGLGNAAVSVDIAPDQDADHAGAVLKDIVAGMRQDPAFAPGMLGDLEYWGVNAVSAQAVTLAGQVRCTDTARWGVQREFNRRLVQRFTQEGIRLARPVSTVELLPPPASPTAASPPAASPAPAVPPANPPAAPPA